MKFNLFSERTFYDIFGSCEDCPFRKECEKICKEQLGKKITLMQYADQCPNSLVRKYYHRADINGRIIKKARLGGT